MTQEYIFQGNRSFKILKTGDVILYVHLISDEPVKAYDWKSVIKSIEYYIGGQKICEWDIEYLAFLSPKLTETLYSRMTYTNGFNFLPIPVYMLPVKNIRFHEIELVINWVTLADPNIKCNVTFANLSENEQLPDVTDMIIHQVYKLNLIDGKPLSLHGAVKYIASRDVYQPNQIIHNGIKNDFVPEADVYLYKHTNTYSPYKISESYYDFFPIDFQPKTCQRLGSYIYIFSSNGKGIFKQGVDKIYNSPTAFHRLSSLIEDVTTSIVVGDVIYAAGYSSGKIMKIDSTGSQTIVTSLIRHPVNLIHSYSDRLILVGSYELSEYNITTGVIYSTSDFTTAGTTIIVPLSVAHDSSNLIGAAVLWYSSQVNDVIRYDLSTRLLTPYPTFNYGISSDINGIPFDQYSTSIILGTDSYYISVNGGVFNYNFSKFINLPNPTYLTMIYDGDGYIYLYPYNGSVVCRFSTNKPISLFLPFCLNTSSSSCGSVYFDNNSELILNGTGNGIVYSVRYNILRIQNGMAGILYA